MAKVTNIRPTIEDELTQLLLESETFVILGKAPGSLKLATNADHHEVYMMLEAMRVELLEEYMDGLLGGHEMH